MQQFSNNASGTLLAGISDSDSNVTLNAGQGNAFPYVNGSDPDEFSILTLEDSAGNFEIVRCTSHAAGSDAFVIVRAQEGTTAQAYSAGDRMELRFTAGTLNEFVQRTGDNIDGQTVNILMKHVDDREDPAPNLVKAQIGLNTADGKLYYGTTLNSTSFLTQPVTVAPRAAPPVNPGAGALWLRTPDNELAVYDTTSGWRAVGVSRDDDGEVVLDGHIHIFVTGETFLLTGEDLYPSDPDTEEPVRGVRINKLNIDEDCQVRRNLGVTGSALVGGGFGVGGETGMTSAYISSSLRKKDSGGYLFMRGAEYANGGQVWLAAQGDAPTADTGQDGDLWIEVV